MQQHLTEEQYFVFFPHGFEPCTMMTHIACHVGETPRQLMSPELISCFVQYPASDSAACLRRGHLGDARCGLFLFFSFLFFLLFSFIFIFIFVLFCGQDEGGEQGTEAYWLCFDSAFSFSLYINW
ncbi:hypothetical protein K504DRAFT_205070 [Pleomassaria siparia CBS 279.74]|uniref:Uncharacterized protein n=1 Tax=Pleomassaria siparia CBS 279.74 TaxID=1314801 RepID=A0A6G1KI73_9PLEO|nr:hypothetical protein K504DRAFT_205070 [Pleomassaria siparia CBS 279.74]